MFYETASQYAKELLPFRPCADITDREKWNRLDADWRQETLRLGEQYLGFSWPYMSATDFLDFTRTGNRVRFETRFFSKRIALNALVLAECVENKGRFLDDILNGIFSICDENAWNLPPHNSYLRDTPQLPLPDLTNPVLDLFSCETGAVLSTAMYLLSPVLDAFSPFLTKRIRYELKRRIYIPYLENHFWWMGGDDTHLNNWTVWCTQNVLLTAFLDHDSQVPLSEILEKACKSTDFFLEEYGEDGCCDEGAQYYHHASLCLYLILDVCNAVTGGAFSSIPRMEKIRNIASYIYKVHIDDKYYINFADCSPVAGRAGTREYLFAKMTGQPEMMDFAAQDFRAGLPDTLLLPTEQNLFYRLLNGFTASEIKGFSTGYPLSHPDIYYPSVGLFAVRDEHLFLAVKAGDNDDSHNHNDTGSFTVYKDGRPLLIDVGVESYTRKTFSPQRYEIWTMQSAYHNLPTIDGKMQQDGAAFCASDVSCDLTACAISMDIAKAYPGECGLLSYHRSACLKKGTEIIIEDTFSFADLEDDGTVQPHSAAKKDHQVIVSLMTCEKPVVVDGTGGRQLVVGTAPSESPQKTPAASAAQLTLEGARVTSIEEIPITDARLATAWENCIYRILVEPAANSFCLRIS